MSITGTLLVLFGPVLETLLLFSEGRGWHDLLREHPRVTGDSKKVLKRRVLQSEICVRNGTTAEKDVDALFGIQRESVLSRAKELRLVMRMLLIRVELAAYILRAGINNVSSWRGS